MVLVSYKGFCLLFVDATFFTLKTYVLDSFVSHFVGILIKMIFMKTSRLVDKLEIEELNLNLTFEFWMASKVETNLKNPVR